MAISAFSRTVRDLGAQARRVELDRAAFDRPLRHCELARCRATCCHDGVVTGAEEAAVVRGVVADHAGQLADWGWRVAGDCFQQEQERLRTATRVAAAAELAEDFPAHFARTRCVFLDDAHRCVLQRLALAAGHHPWFWKPVSCWMHPLQIRPAPVPCGSPLLTVLLPEEDRERFASCTHCGRPDPDGQAAREVLAGELRMLQALAGRDFAAELQSGA
jgi:hypothetical protein